MEVASDAQAAASIDGDDDEPAPVRGELFGTETMAELCVRQGRISDALAIYRGLLATAASPNQRDEEERRARWSARLQALQNPRPTAAAAPTPSPIAAVEQSPARSLPTHLTGTAAAASRAAAALIRPTTPAAAPDRSAARPALGAAPRGAIHRLPVIIREPVRAGQIVYAEKNDLIVVGPVNPGAQLIADGNIHVYGRLRGRAVAGAHGAKQARIYCQRLEAELVGVDTAYLTAEDIPPERLGQAVQIFWDEGRCVIAPL